jgi:hypothetical protein
VRGRIAGDDEQRTARVRDRGQGLDQPGEVLVRALGRDRQRDAAVREPVALAQGRLGIRIADGRGADALRDDVHPRRWDLEVARDVARGRLRDRDDAVRAARRERDEHAHPEPEQPEVRVGHDAVVQVVDRHDAAKRAAQRRRAREAVHELHAGAAREPREQLLLAAHPLDAVARADRHLDDGAKLVPRPPGRGGLAVDERRQRDVGALGGQRAQQLARVGLHAAGLAGNEEDEVQADVHAP